MIYRIEYSSLYLELVKQLREEFGIEIPDSWKRDVCLGASNVSLRAAIAAAAAGEREGGQHEE